MLVAKDRPFAGEEEHRRRRDQLLQRPSTGVPARAPEGGVRRIQGAIARDVVQMGVTDFRAGIPAKH